jgi:drug/metabolite transporter (DMT)-like permease
MTMNHLRIALSIALALGLFAGGVYLLGQDSFFLDDRWDPSTGTLLQGVTLYCLAFGLMFLGSFAGMVGYSWAKGVLPMPSKDKIRPHPSYKGMVIVRFWYLVLPAIILITLAFLQADKAPNVKGFSCGA